jgi:rod shape-determining protein MreB
VNNTLLDTPVPSTPPGSETHPGTLLVGLDLGTNTTCLMAAPQGCIRARTRELIPTVVGYVSEDVLPGVIPGDARVLIGAAALRQRLNAAPVRPLRAGVIQDLPAARIFARHIRDRLPSGSLEVRAVIGVPAGSDLAARESARAAVLGVFDKVIFVPEPFLAALGFRDESRLGYSGYRDPVLSSLYIDIGAGSTDVCLLQGHYPTIDEQLSEPFAGDRVDEMILGSVLAAYPDCGLTLDRVRDIKEKHSFVLADDAATPAVATVMVGGKARRLDVTAQVGAACEALLQKVFAMACELITRADSRIVGDLLRSIIVTGGGSLIKGFGIGLQTKLLEEGFENVRVQVLGDNYKDYVALGALKAAGQAKDRHWQNPIG